MPDPTVCRDLAVEYLERPLGVDEPFPRFSWRLATDRPGAAQRAYRLAVDGVWDSGEIVSPESAQVVYGGPPLAPRTEYVWRVQVRDERDAWSPWSDDAVFETGRMASESGAPWLCPPHGPDPMAPAAHLRRVFSLDRAVKRARLYASALGMYLPRLNGRAATDHCFMPGWTDYRHRVQYQTYDVTALLHTGENALGAVLNEGWYAGRIVRHCSLGRPYGERPAFWCELDIVFADGTNRRVGPDEHWRHSGDSPWRMADIYMGVDYDARREMPGWDAPGFDDGAWRPTPLAPVDIPLTWTAAPPVRRMKTFSPRRLSRLPDGKLIFDVGQNLSGREVFTLAGARPGQTITLRHGEMLRDDGTLYTANLRSARAATVYIAAGRAEETFEPEFTWYGFRYLEIDGLDDEAQLKRLEVHALHSDLEETGEFACSDELVNQLFRNVQWGQRSNFLDIPLDCPQRDERFGWSGDAQAFLPAASLNMDVAAFYAKWLEDLRLCRDDRGVYPDLAPSYLPGKSQTVDWDLHTGAPGWADAGVVCPWELYCRYGDRRLLERHFDAMLGWIDFQEKTSVGGIRATRLYGDWLNLNADLPDAFAATAYFAWSSGLAAKAAGVLGREAERLRLEELARRVRAAFAEEFLPGGRLRFRTQTACAMILAFDLARPEHRRGILDVLVEDVLTLRRGHMSVGFLGAPILCRALADNGRADVAYGLLRQTGYPSWLYPVLQGATTVWERLNSYTRERGFGDEGMNSFNHYAYGAVAAWLYEGVCGLRADPEAPGYRRFRLAPLPGGGLDFARMAFASPAGRIECSWRIGGERVDFDVLTPPGSLCLFTEPTEEAKTRELPAGRHSFSLPVPGLRRDLLASMAMGK